MYDGSCESGHLKKINLSLLPNHFKYLSFMILSKWYLPTLPNNPEYPVFLDF